MALLPLGGVAGDYMGDPVDYRIYIVESYLSTSASPGDPDDPIRPPPPSAPASWLATAGFPTAGRAFGSPTSGTVAPFEFRYASDDYHSPSDDPDKPGLYWEGRVINPGTMSRAISLTSVGESAVEVSSGTIILDNTDGEFDTILDQHSAVSQSIAVRIGGLDYQWRDFETLWLFRITGINISERELSLEVQNPVLYSQNYFPVTYYNGTGGIGGDPSLAGVTRPIVFGRLWNAAPVLLDPVALTYQIHDGPILAITGAFDAGVPLVFSANHASYDALVAATIAPGNYATCLAEGCLRLGSSPDQDVTVHVDGAIMAGTEIRTIATHLAGQLEALVGTDIDLDAFTAIPAGITAGWMWTDIFTFQEAMNRFIGDAGFVWGALAVGPLTVGKLMPPDEAEMVRTFTPLDIIGLERLSLPAGYESTHHRRIVRYLKNWDVQSQNELALTAQNKAYRMQEWKSVAVTSSTVARNAIDPPVLDTSLVSVTHARQLAQHLINLHGQRRKLFALETRIFGRMPKLGDTVVVQYPRFGLDGGKPFRVISIDHDLSQGRASYLIWGGEGLTPSAVATPPANEVLPAITGSGIIGSTLTVSDGVWTGNPTPVITRQWLDDGVAIPGQVGTTLNTTGLAGTITCRVTASNSQGVAFATTNGIVLTTPGLEPANTVAPTIGGGPGIGSILTANDGTWAGDPVPVTTRQWLQDGVTIPGATGLTLDTRDLSGVITLRVTGTNIVGAVSAFSSNSVTLVSTAPSNITPPAVIGTPVTGAVLTAYDGTWAGAPPPVLSRQWLLDGIDIPGATGTTLDTTGLVGAISLLVTAANLAGSASATSATVTPGASPFNTAAPVISGGPAVGATLTSTDGTWTGTPAPTLTRQWMRDGVALAGQTSATLNTTGMNGGTITLNVTGTNASGSTMAASNAIVLTLAPANTAAPVITGSTTSGSILTATSDGVWTGAPAPTLTRQWLDDGVDIPGATGATLNTAGMTGTMTLRVTGTSTSGSTSAVSNAIVIGAGPVNIVAPSISGSGVPGSILTCSDGTWAGSPAPTITRQWRLDGIAIPGQTAPTLNTTGLAGEVTARVTATNSSGSTALNTNAIIIADVWRWEDGTPMLWEDGTVIPLETGTAPAGVAPTNSVAPTISGTGTVGAVLTANPGTWAGSPVPVLTYQWLANGVAISGATAQTFTVTATQAGASVTVRVTGTNASGALSVDSAPAAISGTWIWEDGTVMRWEDGTPVEEG